jgi:hypothetical protein
VQAGARQNERNLSVAARQRIAETIGENSQISSVPIPLDCIDGFNEAWSSGSSLATIRMQPFFGGALKFVLGRI